MKNKIKIKAAILEKNFKPLKLKDIFFLDELKKKQVLVKIQYSGICGSQIGEINAIKGLDKFLPHLLGHEATGKIIKINKYNFKFKVNDKVILHWQKSSGINSKLPQYFDSKGKKINAGWVTTFNNYAVISENRITKLPINISNKNGILFGCGITTAYGALMKNIKKKNINSKKILLTGFGMIGQIMLALMNALKILDITVIENNNNKLRMLKKNYKNINILKNIKTRDEKKFDLAFETTGNKKLIEYSYNNIKNIGKLVLIGVPHHKQKVNINTLGINYGKKIIGSYGGNIRPDVDIPKIANFIKNKNINLNNFLCGPYNFLNINDVLKKLKKGKIIKKPIIKF